MIPLETQLQSDSSKGVVIIRAVGKLLIWKQKVSVTYCKWMTKAEAELVSW